MGKQRYAWVTMTPLIWLVTVTMTAGWDKIFSPETKLGFLSHAQVLRDAIDTGKLPAAIKTMDDARRMLVNDYVDAIVTGFFMVSVVVILIDSIRVWLAFARRRASAESAAV